MVKNVITKDCDFRPVLTACPYQAAQTYTEIGADTVGTPPDTASQNDSKACSDEGEGRRSLPRSCDAVACGGGGPAC